MKKLVLSVTLASLLLSCNSGQSFKSNENVVSGQEESNNNLVLKGKTYYLLSIMSDVQIMEVQLNFTSDNLVESRVSLTADINDCINYKNTPALLEKSKLFHYSFDSGTLEIPELNVLQKIKGVDGENVIFNNGAAFYSTSIVEHLDDQESTDRINAIAPKGMAKFYVQDIHNDNLPSTIMTKTVTANGYTLEQLVDNPNKNKNNPYRTHKR